MRQSSSVHSPLPSIQRGLPGATGPCRWSCSRPAVRAAGRPFEGDIVALDAFVAASERDGEHRPFGYYRITQRSERQAIGYILVRESARRVASTVMSSVGGGCR